MPDQPSPEELRKISQRRIADVEDRLDQGYPARTHARVYDGDRERHNPPQDR